MVRAILGYLRRQREDVLQYHDAWRAMRREGWGRLSTRELVRLYPRWKRSLKNDRTPLDIELPWLTFLAIEFLEEFLEPHMAVCEYGSGGSTLFFARRVRELVSIEHDPQWHKRVQEALVARRIGNVTSMLRVAEPAQGSGKGSPSDPKTYRSGAPNYDSKTFIAYASAIDRYSNEAFHLVLVDGRARPSCIMHAWSKVRVGGYLVVDQSERERYRPVLRLLDSVGRGCHYPGPLVCATTFTVTSAWERAEARAFPEGDSSTIFERLTDKVSRKDVC